MKNRLWSLFVLWFVFCLAGCNGPEEDVQQEIVVSLMPTATPAPTATSTPTVTAVPAETIPEHGIYVSDDGVLYVEGNPYSLTFEDEFEGTELDTTKWERCPEWKRQDLNCYWENECSTVNGDGKLVITSEYRDGNRHYGKCILRNSD